MSIPNFSNDAMKLTPDAIKQTTLALGAFAQAKTERSDKKHFLKIERLKSENSQLTYCIKNITWNSWGALNFLRDFFIWVWKGVNKEKLKLSNITDLVNKSLVDPTANIQETQSEIINGIIALQQILLNRQTKLKIKPNKTEQISALSEAILKKYLIKSTVSETGAIDVKKIEEKSSIPLSSILIPLGIQKSIPPVPKISFLPRQGIPIRGAGLTNGLNRCYFNATVKALLPLISLRAKLQERLETLERLLKTSASASGSMTDLSSLHQEEYQKYCLGNYTDTDKKNFFTQLLQKEHSLIAVTLQIFSSIGDCSSSTDHPLTYEKIGVPPPVSIPELSPQEIFNGQVADVLYNIEKSNSTADLKKSAEALFFSLDDDQKRKLYLIPPHLRNNILQLDENSVKTFFSLNKEEQLCFHSLSNRKDERDNFLKLPTEERKNFLSEDSLQDELQVYCNPVVETPFAQHEKAIFLQRCIQMNALPQNIGILGQLTNNLQDEVARSNFHGFTFKTAEEFDAEEFFSFFLRCLFPRTTFIATEIKIPRYPLSARIAALASRPEDKALLNFEIQEDQRTATDLSLQNLFSGMFAEVADDQHVVPVISRHIFNGTAPSIVPIQIKRFHQQLLTMPAIKIQTPIQIPLTIIVQVQKGTGESTVFEEECYDLRSVVIHRGDSIKSGHYYTYIPNPESASIDPVTGQPICTCWIKHNDDKVFDVDYIHIKEDIERNGYLVFYEKRQAQASSSSSSSST